MDETKARIVEELSRLCTEVQALTGLGSRWNGQVELPPAEEADYRGLKPFRCSIHLRADLMDTPARWRTELHEILHSVSAGYNLVDYQQYKGWEEGTVEQTQRLIRSTILTKLGVVVEEQVFRALEAENDFNVYIAALEEIREALGVSDSLGFYLELLRTPLRERYVHLLNQANQLKGPDRVNAIRTLSRANLVLMTRVR